MSKTCTSPLTLLSSPTPEPPNTSQMPLPQVTPRLTTLAPGSWRDSPQLSRPNCKPQPRPAPSLNAKGPNIKMDKCEVPKSQSPEHPLVTLFPVYFPHGSTGPDLIDPRTATTSSAHDPRNKCCDHECLPELLTGLLPQAKAKAHESFPLLDRNPLSPLP